MIVESAKLIGWRDRRSKDSARVNTAVRRCAWHRRTAVKYRATPPREESRPSLEGFQDGATECWRGWRFVPSVSAQTYCGFLGVRVFARSAGSATRRRGRVRPGTPGRIPTQV